MRKILFINPTSKADVLGNVRTLCLPPINLALLASCTPERYEVKLIDETLERIDFDQEADLVAITAMTVSAPRAYEISKQFRRRGVPVVIGGIHASMMTDEASRYADAVVTGEGEAAWADVLRDAEAGSLRPLYISPMADLERLPKLRRDVLPKGYFAQTVQTSRGCPFNCIFCSVTRFNGGKYRFRPVDDVINEIQQIPDRHFFFVDDNLIGSGPQCARRADQLFERLKGLGKIWGSQTCINIVEDDALLRKAVDSGAKFFFIGFESVEADTLAALNKRVNLRPATKHFGDAIKKLHDHGIMVIGSFIFGNDSDSPDVFDKTVDFVYENQIDAAHFTIQTPLPGTRLYEKLASEGRLTYCDYPSDWKRYGAFDVVFQPQNITAEDLKAGQVRAYRATSTLRKSLLRALTTLMRTRSFLGTAVAFTWNYDSYRAVVLGNGTS